MSTINERLREARKAFGFVSARAAAMHFGWKPSTYAAHENGQNALTAGQARMYSNHFRCSITWLLTGVDSYESDGVIPIVGEISNRQRVNLYTQGERSIYPDRWIENDVLRSFAIVPFRSKHFHLGFEVRGNLLNPIYQSGDLIVAVGTASRISKDEHLIIVKNNGFPVLCYSDTLRIEDISAENKIISGEYFDLNGDVHAADDATEAIPIQMVFKHRHWLKVTKDEVDWSTSVNTFNIQRSGVRRAAERT